jgi:hypothetical protein
MKFIATLAATTGVPLAAGRVVDVPTHMWCWLLLGELDHLFVALDHLFVVQIWSKHVTITV